MKDRIKIVGNGLIGGRFKSMEWNHSLPITIFCSGVSNSSELRIDEYNREEFLLRSQPKNIKIIYFSTCSIFDPDSHNSIYVNKKLEFEKIVQDEFIDHLIIRLPQVVGKGGNNNNLINFLYNSIQNHYSFKVQRYAFRNLMDIDDVYKFSEKILLKVTGTINLASPSNILVLDIVKYIETLLGITAIYQLEERGVNYKIDIKRAASIIDDYADTFHGDYYFRLLKKYFEN